MHADISMISLTQQIVGPALYLGHWKNGQRAVASTRVGGRSAEEGGVWAGGVPLPTGGGVWGVANVLFCGLEMAYFGEF